MSTTDKQTPGIDDLTPNGTLKSGTTMTSVTFNNNGIQMAGLLFVPKGFSEKGSYPALITVHPGGGVKEQTAGVYAQHLAEQGFVTLAFDASHQGASGGMPRFVDDPSKRVVDIYSAIDYLTSLPYVDATRIGALGICAGSGATMLLTSVSTLAAFHAFDLASTLLTQPLLIVAGTKAGSLCQSQELNAVATAGPKELILIEGATHMDLYDGPGQSAALTKLVPFFKSKLEKSPN